MPRAKDDAPAPGVGADFGGVAIDGATAGGRPAATIHGVTDARVAAALICAQLRSGSLLDAAFDAHTRALDPRDRRWTRELVYGMLRRRSALDNLLNQCVRGGSGRLDADLHDILRLGTYQLLHMGSVPAYAAIAQTVELAKRRHGIGASKLANAVLRRIDRERETIRVPTPNDPIDALALECSHPTWIVKRWVARWGYGETRRLLVANNEEGPIILRPVHVVREQLETMLEMSGVHVTDAPLVRDSLTITGQVSSLTGLGAFRRGLFHVQDPAATLVTLYAALPAGATVADVCAAPGGKTIELSRTGARVYASDGSASRLERLRDSVRRLDLDNTLLYVADARRPAIRRVDSVLLDAPCTGTGTFRRHPDARWRITASDITVMAGVQREFLESASRLVRPGGLLIYSTCSLEPEENDLQVDAFLQGHPEFVLDPPPSGAVPDETLDRGRLRVLPQRHGCDGAFAARLRRRGG